MSFDPDKVQRYDLAWKGQAYMQYQDLAESEYGDWVRSEDYDKLLALLHDVSSEADPAGTLRELRLAQDTIRALEARIAELEGKESGWNSVQYLVVPDIEPLPEPSVVEIWVAEDESGQPITELGKTRKLTIPVRRNDPRVKF